MFNVSISIATTLTIFFYDFYVKGLWAFVKMRVVESMNI